MMKLGLCAEDAVTHNLAVVWTGLDAGELKEGAGDPGGWSLD